MTLASSHHLPYSSNTSQIIPSSHKGPLLVHITDQINNINGQGVWTKIYEDGNRNGGWAVDKLIRAQYVSGSEWARDCADCDKGSAYHHHPEEFEARKVSLQKRHHRPS